MLYGDVFKALNKAKVKYVVAGGVAVVLHGFERLTKDLDLIVLLQEDNLDKFFETLIRIGYTPKVPVTKKQFIDKKQRKKWQKEKGMVVFSFYQNNPPHKIVDMFIEEPISFDEIYKKHVRVIIEDIEIPLISIQHLKELKQKAGRPHDLFDIVQLDTINKFQDL